MINLNALKGILPKRIQYLTRYRPYGEQKCTYFRCQICGEVFSLLDIRIEDIDMNNLLVCCYCGYYGGEG